MAVSIISRGAGWGAKYTIEMVLPILRTVTLGLVMLSGAVVTQRPGTAQSSESAVAKVQRLVAGTRYSNRHPNATVWVIAATGPSIGKYDVFVAVSGDIVVVGAVVAKKSQIPLTPAVLQELLRCNHNIDYVKVGLDGDGDAFARMEMRAQTLEAQEFKRAINQVTAATDAVYSRVKPYLLSQ